jgi:hypothetical protein
MDSRASSLKAPVWLLEKQNFTIDDRISLIVACNESEYMRERAKEKARDDYVWFINAFVFTFDPRGNTQHHLPFLLYEFQVETAEWIIQRIYKGEDGIIKKSRDMGITWLYLALIVHQWLFRPGFNALIGSRKEEMVDNFTNDSLFGRIEYIIKRLPGWLQPYGFKMNKHRRERRLMNPENENLILGEATNRDFGRQGRYTVIVFDEAAMWEKPTPLNLAWGSASESTPCRLGVSTPNRDNPNNFFYELATKVVKNVKTIPWYVHPKKDQDWYDRLPERMTPDEIKYEIDISFEISSSAIVYPTWHQVPKGVYPYQRGWEYYTSWDFGINETSIIWWQRNPETGEIWMIDSYQGENQPIDFYVPFVTGKLPSDWPHTYEPHELKKINEHATWGVPINYGDPAGRQRSQTDGKSPMDILEQYGIFIHSNSAANDIPTRKHYTILGFRNLKVNIERCVEVDSAMKNARYPTDSSGRQRTSESNKPVHDWTSHFRTSAEYFFVNLPREELYERPTPERRRRAYSSLVRRY